MNASSLPPGPRSDAPNGAPTTPRRTRILRRVGSITLSVAISAVTIGAIVIVGAGSSMVPDRTTAPEAGTAASVPSSGGPIVVAVALGQSGTDDADALGPYEVFARSSQFSVYAIAATPAPVPLNAGLSVLPTYTFSEAASGVAPAPDVIVVPAVNDPSGESEVGLRDYIVDGSHAGAQILGVCAGARVLAATGLLDGHRATSHWSRIGPLRESNPEVTWVAGQRYVQDGSITTSAGVTSGIPAALRLVQQLAGDEEAERIGREMAYPSWSLNGSTVIPVQQFAPTDLGTGLNAVLPWFRPTVGVALSNGVGEVDAAAPFEVGSYSSVGTVVPLGTGSSVTTAHGLVLLTTPTASAPGGLERVLTPMSGDAGDRAALVNWAEDRGLEVSPLLTSAGHGGFDAALEDLAAHAGFGLADSTAKLIDYPARFGGNGQVQVQPRAATLSLLALGLAIVAGLAPHWVLASRRRRKRATATASGAASSGPRTTEPVAASR